MNRAPIRCPATQTIEPLTGRPKLLPGRSGGGAVAPLWRRGFVWRAILTLRITLILALAVSAPAAFGQNAIVISKPGAYVVPVSITGFGPETESVLKFDLYVLGMEVTAPDKAEYVLSGKDNGHVEGQLSRSGGSAPLFFRSYNGAGMRSQAHALAEEVVRAIRQTPPIFHTKITFCIGQGSSTEIAVADFDGHDAMRVTQDDALVATPCWVPGRRTLLYTSWKNGAPQIFEQDLASGSRKVFARFPGSSFSPGVSPDGRKVAMILSKSGSPNLYVSDIDGGDLKQLTHTREEDSCPCWSPDSRVICFVERRGRAALRKISLQGGEAEPFRVVGPDIFGDITAPDWSPDGKQIIFTCGSEPFTLCVVAAEGGEAQKLVAGEDPCWAPNSRTVIFSRRENNKHVLCLLDVPTKHVKNISQISESCSEPAWAR